MEMERCDWQPRKTPELPESCMNMFYLIRKFLSMNECRSPFNPDCLNKRSDPGFEGISGQTSGTSDRRASVRDLNPTNMQQEFPAPVAARSGQKSFSGRANHLRPQRFALSALRSRQVEEARRSEDGSETGTWVS